MIARNETATEAQPNVLPIRPVQPEPRVIDYDLHGIVGIRLLDASARDAAAVRQQLGPIQADLHDEPDIVIRFVDRLTTPTPLRYLGLDDAGFTDDAFLVLRSKHKAPARVQIPFEQIGGRCEIVCQRGLPAVPLLIPIVNLTALAKGLLPLHASAFIYRGTGALVTGWSKGGKTEMLLAFIAQGAQYVGDEWIYLSADGQQMAGIPEPIRLWDWQLQQLPQYRRLLGRGQRARLAALRWLVRLGQGATASRLVQRGGAGRLSRRVLALLQQQLNVQLPPERMFGTQRGALATSPQKLFFVASHAAPEVTVRPADPLQIARRMVFSLQEERADLLSYYWKFRFAFPEARNSLLEQAEDRQRQLLAGALAGKQAYEVYHPYPVAIASLFEAIQPLWET